MAQPQRPSDVHQDELCPPKIRYALMDANKNIDLNNPRYGSILSEYSWFYSRVKITIQLQDDMTLTTMISRRARDKYHNLEDDVMVKNIFNSEKHKDSVGMKIPSWMIMDEIKLTDHHRMYVAVFRVDVPTTQSQPIESTQGTHRTTSAPRTPNLEIAEGKSSASRKSTVIRLHTFQVSLVEQKSHKELEAKQNMEIVKEHLMAEEIEKLVEGMENVENAEVVSSPLRQNDNQNDPDTRLEPKSDKESPKVEKIDDILHTVNVYEEEEESAEDDYELRRREKGKHVKESRSTPSPTTIRSPRILSTLIYLDTEKLHELTVDDPPPSSSTPSSSSSKISATNHLLSLLKPKTRRFKRYKSFFNELQGKYGHLFCHLKRRGLSWKEKRVKQMWPSLLQMQFSRNARIFDLRFLRRLMMLSLTTFPHRDQDDPHDDAHPEGENSTKRRKRSEHGTFMVGESSSGQDYESEPGPSTSSNQEQSDDFDFWTNSYATNDDKGNSEPKKIALSLHKFPAVIFPDDDKEERTSRWVEKCVKRFNPYARYGVKHWKNSHAKIFYIKKQQEPGKLKEEVYSNSKIVDDYAETGLLWSLSVFIRSTMIWERVHNFQLGVESYQQKVNLTAPTITFPGIEKYEMFSIVTDPVYGIIYENNKKKKKVMRHQEIYNLCDATLKRVLEGLKSYNNDVKYGYVTSSLSKEDAEYMQLFTEEIEERLKHRDQMTRIVFYLFYIEDTSWWWFQSFIQKGPVEEVHGKNLGLLALSCDDDVRFLSKLVGEHKDAIYDINTECVNEQTSIATSLWLHGEGSNFDSDVRSLTGLPPDCYLVHILNEISSTSSMVFTHTCKDTQRVALMLGNLGVRAIPILAQMVQAERLAAVNMFNSGECNILVCSDVGIRGLDIPSVDTVINYAIPPIAEDYIHRVERTGFSILLVNQYEIVPYTEIERQHIGKRLRSCYAHDEEAMSLAERVKEANQLALKVSTSFESCISY
ncbi:retrovirus-related pol polyprotein from transposon TNT 1-94 [Tanacetum coccineum]